MPKPFALASDLAGLRTLFVDVFIVGILFIGAVRTLAEAGGTPGPLIVAIVLLLIPARGLLNVRSLRTAWPPGAIAWAILSVGYPIFCCLYVLLASSSPDQGSHPLCSRMDKRMHTSEGIAAVCVSGLYGVLSCMLSIRVEWRRALIALTAALNGLAALLVYARCGDGPGHFWMQNTAVVCTSFALGEALRSLAEVSAVALTQEHEAAVGSMRELVDSAHEEAAAATAKADAMEDELQRDIAYHAFDQLGLIGRGGCADVFLVRKRLTTDGGTGTGLGAVGKLFALKRIVKGRLTSANHRQVEEESCILHRIDHPFLVSLHYSFQSPRCFYFCMTYAPGGDLVRWMEMISADGARTVTAEVLLAVEYLHGTGILYRDVKPENTLVGEDGHVMLADFGVAKRIHRTGEWAPSSSAQPPDLHADVAAADQVAPDTKSRAATLKHTCVGTLEYMCPELFDGMPYSFEVDFWAVAVMLHEMLTGDTVGSIRAPDITAGAWRARPLS